MFCDLVGSTVLSTQLDPEEMSNILSAFQKVCTSAVTGFGGLVAKYMGDAVDFGYPEAHEDDAGAGRPCRHVGADRGDDRDTTIWAVTPAG